MSVRTDLPTPGALGSTSDLAAAIGEAADPELALAEGTNFTTVDENNFLTRNLAVSIRASLSELCLQKGRAAWKPSPEANKRIFRQNRFTSLDGSAEAQGDLKSVVLHSTSLNHVKSTFPVALGANITSVDANTFSSTGEAFSTVFLSNSESSTGVTLQKDDPSLSYEFSKKYPVRGARTALARTQPRTCSGQASHPRAWLLQQGYTAANIAEKGVSAGRPACARVPATPRSRPTSSCAFGMSTSSCDDNRFMR